MYMYRLSPGPPEQTPRIEVMLVPGKKESPGKNSEFIMNLRHTGRLQHQPNIAIVQPPRSARP